MSSDPPTAGVPGAIFDPDAAARAWHAGELVGFPTETVYGVGVSAAWPGRAERVYALKQRPRAMPLMLHVEGPSALERYTRDCPAWARAFVASCWPGPLTLVFEAAPTLDRRLISGGDTVALRVPDHPAMLAALAALSRLEGGPAAVAGSSANVHGEAPARDARELRRSLGPALAGVLEGGAVRLGEPSTLIRVEPAAAVLLREGAIDREQLRARLPVSLRDGS